MNLQDQGDAFDGGGVGAFAALGESLFNQLLRVGQLGNLLASRAFATKIVSEPLAIGGLRKHPGKGVLAYTTRAGKQQCMRHPGSTKRTAQRGDHSFAA
jgi:hypothetical protein